MAIATDVLPWVEKYRPKTIDEVASQDAVTAVLKRTLTSSNIPHLLFYGPPGTGKTSTILALAHDLFGPRLYRQRLLELNASDERGIAVIRDKVKEFAKVTARESAPGYPCPPFKLIVLDEADSLTGDAQTALRRVIEVSSKNTRFCLICNYVSRIIDPLTSRCAKFRFKPVDPSDGIAKLAQISALESVRFDDPPSRMRLLGQLLSLCEGDLRRAIMSLQSAHRLGLPLSEPVLYQITGIIPDSVIQSALRSCQQASVEGLVAEISTSVVREGYPAGQFIQQLLGSITDDSTVSSMAKSLISILLAEADHALADGADEHLQLLAIVSKISDHVH